jgi:hypothetical protein
MTSHDNPEPRFYIVDIDESHPAYQQFPDWYGVVDDEQGGIVAVFKSENIAKQMIQAQEQTAAVDDKMRAISVKITALNSDGAIFALQEVVKQIQDGYTSGFNSNEEGESFSWDSDLQIGD